MPKYFKSKSQQLHCEAYATMLLITAMLKSASGGDYMRLLILENKAHKRVYRRWINCEGYK